MNEDKIIAKAQIHAGGRGKAGGVKLCKNENDVIETVDKMIGMKIVTPQTSEEGKVVRRVYLEKGYDIEKEFYFLHNRGQGNWRKYNYNLKTRRR